MSVTNAFEQIAAHFYLVVVTVVELKDLKSVFHHYGVLQEHAGDSFGNVTRTRALTVIKFHQSVCDSVCVCAIYNKA